MEDRYVLYVLVYGIPDHIFWYKPIATVERIYEGKRAYDGWAANPK
ncbi:hypothetical protein [Evansella clarkii]|nr:hypothetical protein [Evansella clarkii]